jgi:CPA2 family monovalent cation:H+ antiporter-2
VAAFLIVKAFRHPTGTAALIAASLAQIGEFSFILAALGVDVGLLPSEGRDLIITGAILSILLNPLAFVAAERFLPRGPETPKPDEVLPTPPEARERRSTALVEHTILAGYGRVGSIVAHGLAERGAPFLVVEDDDKAVARLASRGIEHIVGNAVLPEVLEAANISAAKTLILAIPNGFEAGNAVIRAKAANPAIRVVARAHSAAEVEHLDGLGADKVIMGEEEIAKGMLEYSSEPEVIPDSVSDADATDTQDPGMRDAAAGEHA